MSNPKDRVYLTPVDQPEEPLTEDFTQILFCDSDGTLTTSPIETSLVELLEHSIKTLYRSGLKAVVAVCLEVAEGQSVSFCLKASKKEVATLGQIISSLPSETGIVPDKLKKNPSQIIKRAKKLARSFQGRDFHPYLPEVDASGCVSFLIPNPPEWLIGSEVSYSTADDIGLAPKIPVFPALVLEKLPPNQETRAEMQRVLVLTVSGLPAIIRVPIESIAEGERALDNFRKTGGASGVVVVTDTEIGVLAGFVETRKSQKKALAMLKQQFEEKEHWDTPISRDAQVLILKARDVADTSLADAGLNIKQLYA